MNATEIHNAALELFAAEGWTRHEEVRDLTREELDELDHRGQFTRDGRNVVGVGQTDTEPSTYAFEEADEEGSILIAPHVAGTLWSDDGERRRQNALEMLAAALFDVVPDGYCQSIAFRI